VDVGIAEAATHAYADEGVPILRSTNVRANKILLDDILRIQPWFAEKNRSKYLLKDDIVTVRTGNAGVSAVIPEELHKSQCFTMLISTLRRSNALVSTATSLMLNQAKPFSVSKLGDSTGEHQRPHIA